MAITSAICSSFKQELLQGKHDFETSGSGGHTFKLALFTSSASLGAATTDYSTSNEISNTSGSAYTAGGKALTNTGVGLTGTTAFTDFSDVSKSCLPCKSSCLKLEHIADVIAIIYLLLR